jgi:hypothetical protein
MIDTTRHMIAAYVAATVIYVLYTFSLWSRAKKYKDAIREADPSRRSG